LGFMAINLLGLAIAVFIGVSLVYNELEKKTIYTIVSKPIGRWQFLLGKYFGLLMTVWVNVLIMTFFFLISIHTYTLTNDPANEYGLAHNIAIGILRAAKSYVVWNAYPASSNIMPVIAITLLELMLVTAFSLLYSSFSTPTLSMFLTILTFIAGRLNEEIL